MKHHRFPNQYLMRGLAACGIILAAAPAFAAVDGTAHPATPPTFSGSVAQIVYTNCTPCHRPDGGAPMSFMDYEETKKRARLIARVTTEKYMPPWKAEPGEVAFHGERHLSEGDIATLAAWAEAGAPLGDAAAVPAPPTFKTGWHHGEPDLILEMEEEMPIPADGPDIYRGFVVRIPELPEGKYLKGMEYRPQAIQTAHHTLFSLDTTGEARAQSELTPKPGFGGMESNLSIGRIGGWAVGAIQPLYPEGVSLDIQPGTDLVLSTHFHPVGKPEVERAQIGVYLTDEKPTRYMTGLDLPFGFGLLKGINIPAGEKNYRVEESYVIPEDVRLAVITPHAHYLATSMEARATFPDGREMILISVADWDFAWQEQYQLEEELPLPKGTRIDLEFVYDNSSDNPRNPNNPPVNVTFGPESTDEMACMTLGLIQDSEEQQLALRQDYVAWVKQGIGKADLSLIVGSAREQRRDRFDIDGNGDISFSEIWATLGGIRQRIERAGQDPNNLQSQIMGEFAKRALMTVWLPWFLPRFIATLLVIVLSVVGLRMALRSWRRARRGSSAEGDTPASQGI